MTLATQLQSWKFWLGSLLLLGLIILVEKQYGWLNLLASWKTIPPSSLALALVLMLCSYLLRALRFYDFFYQQVKGHGVTLVRITVIHNFLNNMLPMRTGEVSFPVLMKQQFNIAVTHSAPALLWLRLLDLYVLIALSFVSLQSLLPWGSEARLAIALVLLVLPFIVYALQNVIERALSNHPSKISSQLHNMMTELPSSPLTFVRAIFWTVLNWALKIAIYAWLLKAFTGLSFVQAWSGATTGELSSVLPIHGVAGAGTYEAGVLAGLMPWGLDYTTAFAAAVNLHLFVLTSTFLLTGLILLLARKRKAL